MKNWKRSERVTPDELLKQIEAIQNELFVTDVHFEIYLGLKNSWPNYEKEFRFSPRFWEYTFQAHITMAVLRLCRIYDTDDQALSLPNFLKAVENNLNLFNKKGFGEKDLSPKHLDGYKKFCSPKNPTVKQLLIWRNNLLAHFNRKQVLANNKPFHEKYPLPLPDIKGLIKGGFEIVNQCANKFGTRCFRDAQSTNYPVNDYQIILDLLWNHREANFKD